MSPMTGAAVDDGKDVTGFLQALVSLSLLMGLGIGFSRVITTLYAVQLNAHGWMLAAVALSQSIGMLLLAAPAGHWVARHGVRVVFILGSLWGALVYLLTPLVPSLPALLIFSAAASLAMPPRFVSINTIFMSRLEAIGQQRAGWFRAAHVIGMSFVGAVLATTLFPAYGARIAFWIASAIFALNIAVFVLGLGRHWQEPARVSASSLSGSLFKEKSAARTALWEFAIRSLNAYFAFYIVVVVVRYLRFPETVAGYAVALQGVAFVLTLIGAGRLALKYRRQTPVCGTTLVLIALVGLAFSKGQPSLFLAASLLGMGLGLLQIINLRQFARLGERIGFSRAASINALSGPTGGVFGGLLGGVLDPWILPQHLFLLFIPLIAALVLWPHDD